MPKLMEQHYFIQGIEMKKCPKCGEIKPLSEFSKDSNRSDGVQSYCKECQCKISKKYRIQHTETAPEPETISLRTNKEEIRPDAKVYDNIIVLDHQSKTNEHNIKVLKEAIEKREYGPYDAALLETILSEIRDIKVIVNKLCASDYDKQFALMQDVVLRMSKERGAA